MVKKLYHKILEHPAVSLIIYAIIIRILVVFFYDGFTIVNDSQGYIDLAKQLTDFNVDGETGRTLGFPLLIALANNNLPLVIHIQLVLGVLSTYLIFDITKIITTNKNLALLVGVITTSFMHFVFFEMAIMTETLSLFTLLGTFWLIAKYDILDVNSNFIKLLILSTICAFLYLVRPMFIYIPILLALFFVVRNFKQDYKKALSKSLIIVLIPIIAFYSWCSFNEKNIGVFGSTWLMGINLSQNATSFFEKAPDEEALIRDIFVKHRNIVKTTEPNYMYPMSVWAAYDELIEKTQLSPPELSTKIGEISINLFKKHPDLYLKQVFISWKDFWNETLIWSQRKVPNNIVKKGLVGLWHYIQQHVGLLINLLFLVFSIKKIITFIKTRFKTFDFELLIVATVILGSIAQALVTYGSNGRFSFPYFPLIVYFVMVNLFNLKNKYVRNTST